MTMQPPTPVAYSDENPDAYYEYLALHHDYMFKTRWLKIALTPAEFAATESLDVGLLKSLHQDIYEQGPMGAKLYTQLRKMIKIFNREVPEIDPMQFFTSFLATYQAMTYEYSHVDVIWQKLKTATAADFNDEAMYPDVDSYHGGPLVEVFDTRTFAILDRQEDERGREFGDALDDFARITLLSYIMRDMDELVARQVCANHDAFVAKYDLLGAQTS